MPKNNLNPALTRRDAATLLFALGGTTLIGCGGGDESKGTTTETDTGAAATDSAAADTTTVDTAAADAATVDSATVDSATADTATATDATTTGWASGGTKSMTAKASYPDPLTAPVTACPLHRSATEGPCTEAADQVRVDISEGYTGIPMRTLFRFVDLACKPIAGAKVKIWHTSIAGSYSGNTPNNAFCLKLAADSTKHYFRGVQTTDADGRVGFDSCYPGWYPGRCIHIHFTITYAGKSFTGQVIFDQAMTDEIFATHPEYKPYGKPDTSNTTDGIAKVDIPGMTMATARMSDGAMLASKVIAVNV